MKGNRRLKGLEGAKENRPPLNVMVVIQYPDGRLFDTGSGMYVTEDDIKRINPETLVTLPDNGRELQP